MLIVMFLRNYTSLKSIRFRQLTNAVTSTTISKRIRQCTCRPQHNNNVKLVSSAHQQQRGNSSNSHALQYLETWVGNNKSSTNQSQTNANSATPNSTMNVTTASSTAMQVSGSSYILPTIRLDKSISSCEELNVQLESFFDSSNRSTPHAIRSMLKPKPVVHSTSVQETNNHHNNHKTSTSTSANKGKKFITWRVPIILDLKAFQHDGSPHYKPPPDGFVRSIVDIFDKWGIAVIGVCNIQQDENRDVSTVKQVVDLGLPVLMPKVGRTLGGTLNKNGANNVRSGGGDDPSSKSYGVEELVQLVTKHMENVPLSEQNESSISIPIPKDVVDDAEIVNAKEGAKEDINEDDSATERTDLDEEIIDIGITPLLMEDIDGMSFRELQKECKARKLGAVGNSDLLQQRLIDHLGLSHHDKIHNDKKPIDNNNNNNNNNNNISSTNEEEEKENDNNDKKEPLAIPPVTAKVYQGNVRSGQQVTTDEPNQSLIIIGNVSSGGEVMSDGDIFVYGALRGRALAGLSKDNGDSGQSKIFASRFDAELVCIGSHFTTIDSISDLGLKSTDGAMVSIDENKEDLKFTKF